MKFPSFNNIKYFYDRKCYTNEQIKRFVELEYINEEEFKEITGGVEYESQA
ncbi:XkdX family protein [Staphylococcus intermedius]|uniref:XkdX family protein n=1 Tax=Staphylococcus intermedius TaxID=1285 RepID=UPI000BBC57E4|nr:XkdX family protein [Staphylococcus intermedius]PCF86405.1 hypothetical protein B4W75_10645 [Staphylococcus intermedius]